MSLFHFRNRVRGRVAPIAALCLMVGLSGCGLDKVEIPQLDGPSTFGLSLVVNITPDVLTADAISTASVQAHLLGPDGLPVGGRAIFFQITDLSGVPLAIGQLGPTSDRVPNNRGPEVTEITGPDGIAQVIYRVPERIAFNDTAHILIQARVIGNDANSHQYKTAALELRPAEARVFPGTGLCTFIVDPPVGPYKVHTTIRMQTTASDATIRYYWDFGDGTSADGKTEVDKAYNLPGSYQVTHVCTTSSGSQSTATKVINIVP